MPYYQRAAPALALAIICNGLYLVPAEDMLEENCFIDVPPMLRLTKEKAHVRSAQRF